MKIKHISFLALSLLFSLSALRAIPTDPSTPGTTNDSNESSIILTDADAGKPVQITTAQTITIMLLPTDAGYSFSDTSLTDLTGTRYAFNFLGAVDGKNIDCVNMAIKRNAPLVFLTSSLNCLYTQMPTDSTDSASAPDLTYYPITFYSFVFRANVVGSTTLTFSDDVNVYTYPITVSAAPAK